MNKTSEKSASKGSDEDRRIKEQETNQENSIEASKIEIK